MTEALTTGTGPQMRVIDSRIGPVVPINDIAEMIGYTRQGLSALVRSHKDTLSPSTLSLSLSTAGGDQETQCITRDGLDKLFLLMKIPRDPVKMARFLELRQNILAKFTGGKMIAQVAPVPALSDVLTEYGKQARILADEWGVDLPVARKVSMAAAVEHYPDLTYCRALIGTTDIPALPAPVSGPKADPDYDRYFGIRDVAKFCQCQENQARKILVDEGVIAYQNDHVVLTPYGKRFAKIFTHYPEFPHRMTEKIIIRYSPDAVQLVRGKLFCIQTTLPAAKAHAGA